jgi:tRNA C32,U32 (ribose-2'-O)-methylase TrmJ
MATTLEPTTELNMKLRLSKAASDKLAQRAAETGRDVAAVASDLLERAVTQPSVDEMLAGFRQQVAASGMSDAELDAFFRAEIDAYRREKKAKPA